jgi:hypothetical protein
MYRASPLISQFSHHQNITFLEDIKSGCLSIKPLPLLYDFDKALDWIPFAEYSIKEVTIIIHIRVPSCSFVVSISENSYQWVSFLKYNL